MLPEGVDVAATQMGRASGTCRGWGSNLLLAAAACRPEAACPLRAKVDGALAPQKMDLLPSLPPLRA